MDFIFSCPRVHAVTPRMAPNAKCMMPPFDRVRLSHAVYAVSATPKLFMMIGMNIASRGNITKSIKQMSM
jgi:hypothetical protein